MKNREKYAKQILDIACEGNMVTLKDGNLCDCNDVPCMQCDFCFSSSLDGSDCRGRFKKWCEAEYVENPKISESDRRFLDYLPSKEAWMARDNNGRLCLYCKNKPEKTNTVWFNSTDLYMQLNMLMNVNFPMVKWEDSEPWSIEDLKKLEVEK